ncbi:hypothetical protein RRG08_047107 [Elysia crispata]|uniref:Uncharacterized protein n=1 Tax=Elysia crispata TaxID=231223 RepID=A0AAE1ANR5_9GAST|nr:hypothetical protein RRG08_047107 [Elysia crispata]
MSLSRYINQDLEARTSINPTCQSLSGQANLRLYEICSNVSDQAPCSTPVLCYWRRVRHNRSWVCVCAHTGQQWSNLTGAFKDTPWSSKGSVERAGGGEIRIGKGDFPRETAPATFASLLVQAAIGIVIIWSQSFSDLWTDYQVISLPAGAEIFTVLLLIKMGKFQSGIKGKEIKIPVTPCYRIMISNDLSLNNNEGLFRRPRHFPPFLTMFLVVVYDANDTIDRSFSVKISCYTSSSIHSAERLTRILSKKIIAISSK